MRISKQSWYRAGGFSNRNLYRKMIAGIWQYYES